MENVALRAGARNAYRALTEPGMTISTSSLRIINGVRGVVKLGTETVASSSTYPTKAQAMRWAVAEAKRFRTYRQQNGEGIEEVRARKRALEKAAGDRSRRLSEKRTELYDLVGAMASDLELLADDLPKQAAARAAKARALIEYIDDNVMT